ncbi:radical SAM/SPASM domain-containing protein [Thermodesulfovibrio sp. 1176]|uniref:radical SAM protein n=1 Tax=Thermodesulfovibrio sp. 1176 TaxID=3043424 RepID=UPI0024832738|nr:radical SAM/SPASM domain-containing protein [Thermodesulfovibrio sp. 1176]MDI1472033.1 radical SAM/SPASM domain-containing protein [Thermodesulfovibrio sp. 1176]
MIEYVQFFPTLRCNKNCKFCFNRGNNSQNFINQDFPAEKVEDFVNLLKENKISNLDILGGEPFLYDALFKLVKLAIKKNMEVNISTNGIFLEKIEKLIKLCKNPKLHIGVSINDEVNPKLLKLINKNKLWIKSVITENQLPDEKILNFTSKMGIDYYLIYMDALTERDLEISMPFYEFIELIKKLQILYPNIKPVYCNGFIGGGQKYRCPAGTEKITVMPDGKVYPCYLLSGFKDYCLGNIFENSLQEIISSEKLNIFKKFFANICNNKICKLKKICSGGCVAHGIIHYGNLKKADPRCEKKVFN